MTIKDRINNLKDLGADVYTDQRPSTESIAELEKWVGGKLPLAYKTIVTNYGSVGIGDVFISGIVEDNVFDQSVSSFYGLTMMMRNEYGLEEGVFAFQEHEDGAFCFKCSEEEDWEPFVFEIGHLTKLDDACATFEEYFISWVIEGLEKEYA